MFLFSFVQFQFHSTNLFGIVLNRTEFTSNYRELGMVLDLNTANGVVVIGLDSRPCLLYLCSLYKTTAMKQIVTSFTLALFACSMFGQITYYEVSSSAGINHLTGTQFYGGGISFVDFTGDGLDDLTLATDTSDYLHFYENVGGTFVQLAPLVTEKVHAKQVLWVDFDNDGDKDLMVAGNQAITRLYENDGSLNMTDITASAGLPLDSMPVNGFTFGDYDNDGWLDIYYTTYSGGTWPFTNYLYHSNGNGTFTDVTDATTAVSGKSPFCASFFDYNNDGFADLYIANDRMDGNTVLLNNGGTSFSDASSSSNGDLAMNSMNVGIGDFNDDGYSDVYITNTPLGNKLLSNNQDGTFSQVADACGVGYYGVGWGANFVDYDNDTDLDLYVCGMWVDDDTSNVMYENLSGTFANNTSIGFMGDTVESYCNAIGDFNDDGYPDIMVTNKTPFPSQLWVHTGGTNNYVKIDLEGFVSNRDGIGARIDYNVAGNWHMRYTHSAIGYLAQNSDWQILGLGAGSQIDTLVVTWPSGIQDVLYNVPAGWSINLLEGTTTGIDESAIYIRINIYPVPATNEVTVSMELNESTTVSVQIINALGEVVQKTGQSLVAGSNVLRYDVSQLPAGIYNVVITDDKGSMVARPLIIN